MLSRLQLLKQMLCDKSDELAHQFTRVYWLEKDNARLIMQIDEANTLVSDLEARDRVREEALAQARREHDVQRAAAEREAQNVEAQVAALQQKYAALEAKEAEL